ncbi:MAG: translation initiation factor IF-3 [Planctomycetota bacterium]|nr:translation initiation factor IF-3 [Planctomycetota bacterium]MDA0933009.1 translation initiation factor IF-3 [Planctomycetota bacterium]MDA1221089.1 translation initiation factor IF-3 [Planctomycetota bacterium]
MAMRRPPRGRPAPPRGPRTNQRIRVKQVRCIDEEGKMLGVMDTADALAIASQKGLDLVEIAPDQRPPVCRIMDFGKFKYEQKKKDQASKKKQHQSQVKEVRVRPKIAEHDVMVKVRKAREFLAEGDRVQINCLFRGREMAHKELGIKVMQEVFQHLQDIARVEREPHLEGRRMVMLIAKK